MNSTTVMIGKRGTELSGRLAESLRELNYTLFPTSINESDEVCEQELPHIVLFELEAGDLKKNEADFRPYKGMNRPIIFVGENSNLPFYRLLDGMRSMGFIRDDFTIAELKASVDISLFRHEVEKSLEEKGEWLTSSLQNIDDSLFTTDKNGIITSMNQAAYNLTGFGAERALGRHISDIVQPIDKGTGRILEVPVCNLLRGGPIAGLGKNTMLLRFRECPLSVELKGTLINSESGAVAGSLLVASRHE